MELGFALRRATGSFGNEQACAESGHHFVDKNFVEHRISSRFLLELRSVSFQNSSPGDTFCAGKARVSFVPSFISLVFMSAQRGSCVQMNLQFSTK